MGHQKFTEKQITRSLNCWCFTEFFSDLITRALCLLSKTQKKPTNIFGATCKIFANNLGGVA